jgi:hypothetical protein
MKRKGDNMKRTALLSVLVLLLAGGANAYAQNARPIIQKAMHDELQRNLERLSMEKLNKPFFISYTVSDMKTLHVSASLGALITSDENPSRDQNVRVMVGDYKRNNENFFEMSELSRNTMLEDADRVSLENDYSAIRRSLWLATDNTYKRCAESLARKTGSLEQQKLSAEEAALDDFSKAEKVSFSAPARLFEFQKNKWETTAKELSALFRNYPAIQSSEVTITFQQGDIYFTNTEGTETVTPFTWASIKVFAGTQATDGAPLKDFLFYYGVTPDDLSSPESMKKDIVALASNLTALRAAPVLEPAYTGPVLFEDQAVGELIAERLFSGSTGFIAERKPIFSDPNMSMGMSMLKQSSFEDKIDTRVLPKEITIRAVPSMTTFEKTNLIGSFAIDAEGVKPPKELMLVEKGMLKTLLCDRVPTLQVHASNGHARYIQGATSTATGPGVIVMSSTAGKSSADLKKELLRLAKESGLKYALIVRKLSSPYATSDNDFDISALMFSNPGEMDKSNKVSDPILLYKVDVASGKEELVRSTVFPGIDANALRKIAGVDKKQMAYNTTVPGVSSGMGGMIGMLMMSIGGPGSAIPASFITPRAILFEELEVKKEKRSYTAKLPVVESPLK